MAAFKSVLPIKIEVPLKMINFVHNLFGVDSSAIIANHLVNYFSVKRLETDTLEFKSFPAQANFETSVNKILKTICGFLNGSGGLLILGAPLKTTIDKVDYFQGDLTPLSVQKSIDWFINKISSNISPMPINISINTVEVGKYFVYLFEVQESQYKPHQNDSVYYIRLDGQTKPAPHYIVQALMRQITYPDIRGSLRINRFVDHANQTLSKLAIAIYNFSQLQNEVDYSYTLTITGGAEFFAWNTNNLGNEISVKMDGAQLIHKPISRPLHFGMPYVRSFNITIPDQANAIKFLFTFGGRFSPAKMCVYELDLTDINKNDPQTNITILKDNELFEAAQTIDEALDYFRNNAVI